MICLTGDLHHQSLGTGNQAHCDLTEIEVARRFLELLKDANVKVTFFISGKAFAEQADELRPIVDSPLVELGGHNYSCFQPQLMHRVWNKLTGNYNGPRLYQYWDARRTIETIANHTGRRIRVWRNHQYMHGPHTEQVLSSLGIRLCSDGVDRYITGPGRHRSGIYNFPLNIIPDHEHLYHAERTPQWVAQWQERYNWSDDFGSRSYFIEEWTELVLEGLRQHRHQGVISNMIIHPITMYLCDQFRSFKKILAYLESHQTAHLTETIDRPRRAALSDHLPARATDHLSLTSEETRR